MGETAYVTLPGLSTTSLLLNLPSIYIRAGGSAPIIFIDQKDFTELRAEAINRETAKYDRISMAYDYLRRQELLIPIDYARYYSATTQQTRLTQIDALIDSMPDEVNRHAAFKASKGWKEYGRGEYQDRGRAYLGEDRSSFEKLRRVEHKEAQKIKRGTNDPESWNKKMLYKSIAALEVRHALDEQFPNITVTGVITGYQHEIVGGLLDMTRAKSNPAPQTEILDYSRGIVDFDASSLEHLEPNRRMSTLHPHSISSTRKLFDSIGLIAAETCGTDADEWFILGPSLALPNYSEFFDHDELRRQAQSVDDFKTIGDEARRVYNTLTSRNTDQVSPEQRVYRAEWLQEEYDPELDRSHLTGLIDYSLDLSTYTQEVESLHEDDTVSPLATLAAVGTILDPQARRTDNEIHQRTVGLVRNLDPEFPLHPSRDRQDERRGDRWESNENWFESEDRSR